MPITSIPRADIEAALDSGKLYVNMGVKRGSVDNSPRWWKARRNGRTQTWKTRPDDFRIPVKAGFKECGAIVPANADTFCLRIGEG